MRTPFATRASSARLLVGVTVLAVGLAAFSFVLYDVLSARGQAIDALGSLKGQIGQQQSLQRAAAALNATASERAALLQLPIAQGGGADFIASIEALGTSARVITAISSVSAKPPAQSAPGQLSLSVHFSGSYAACERFVRLIETMRIPVVLSQLSLDYNAADKEWDGSLALSALSFDTP